LFYLKLKRAKGFIEKAKYLFGLSRTPHALLDMTAPALAALTWLGTFPSYQVTILGLLTLFSGYTAVYALNDVMDYNWDKEKIKNTDYISWNDDLDSLLHCGKCCHSNGDWIHGSFFKESLPCNADQSNKTCYPQNGFGQLS